MRLVVIGGSDAGISAGLRARELEPSLDVQIILADRFPNYSICGLPFYVSGETADWRHLAHRTSDDLRSSGLTLVENHRVASINPASQTIAGSGPRGEPFGASYDALVIATGAEPVRPRIPGIDLDGVHFLHTMEDSFRVRERAVSLWHGRVLIIGGGYIGLEMADALTHRGLSVTLVEQLPEVMPTVDASLGRAIADELRRHDVEVVRGTAIERVDSSDRGLAVAGSGGFHREADLVLVSTGVRPASALATEVGIEVGDRGAIRVGRGMHTNLPGVYAAGDCVETWHRLLQEHRYLPLGTTSHKQGRVAGENAVGGQAEFQGSLGTQVVKIFSLAVARSGLRDDEARRAGFDPVTTETRTWDHESYYPGAHELKIRITGDRVSGRLLGAQILGHWQAEVAKRIDVLATALVHEMTVDGINELDLSYTPPFSAPWDPVQVAAQEWRVACRP